MNAGHEVHTLLLHTAGTTLGSISHSQAQPSPGLWHAGPDSIQISPCKTYLAHCLCLRRRMKSALCCCALLALLAATVAAKPSPPQACGTLDLTARQTQHCFPKDASHHFVCCEHITTADNSNSPHGNSNPLGKVIAAHSDASNPSWCTCSEEVRLPV